MTKILVPTAGPGSAAEIADYVMQIATAMGAEVCALHVVRPGGSTEAGELSLEYFVDAARKRDVSIKCALQEGAIINQIVEFAEENQVDLIVMGASNGSVVNQWVSSDVRENTMIPVLVIPYQIFDGRSASPTQGD